VVVLCIRFKNLDLTVANSDINIMLLSFIREYRPRENVSFLENGTKIFATNPKSFVFLRNLSVGDPEVDRVTTVNIPFIVRRVLFSCFCTGS